MAKNKNKKFSSFIDNPIDYTLLITVLLLLTLGLIMVLSASSPIALKGGSGNSYSFFIKQAIFAALGLCAMGFISKIDYRFYKKFYIAAYVISIILLIAVLLFGRTVNNAKRWIGITDTLSFQPSEIVKFGMIVFYAGLLTKDREELKYFVKGWLKHIIWLIPILILLLLEPHMSVSIVIIGIVGIMMILAGCKFWQILIPRNNRWSSGSWCINILVRL